MDYLNYVRCPTCGRPITKSMVEEYPNYISKLTILSQEKDDRYKPFFQSLAKYDKSNGLITDVLKKMGGPIADSAIRFLENKMGTSVDNQMAIELLKGFGNKYTPIQAMKILEKQFGRECCRMRLQTPFRVPLQSSVINTPEGALGPLLSVKATTTVCDKSIATKPIQNAVSVMTTTTSKEPTTIDLDKSVVTAKSPGLKETVESQITNEMECELADLEENLADRLGQLDNQSLASITNTDPQINTNEQSAKRRFFALTNLAHINGRQLNNMDLYEQIIEVDPESGEKKIKRVYRAR